MRVTNSGPVAGAEVVELYGSDPFASVTRATVQLAGFHRLELEPGQSATVHFDVPTRQYAFSDKNLKRIVEPGAIEISLRRSAIDLVSSLSLELIGDVHLVTNDDRRIVHTWLD